MQKEAASDKDSFFDLIESDNDEIRGVNDKRGNMTFEEYKRKYQATISSHSFLEKVAAWCKYNGYVLNPVHLRNDKDKKRILRFVEKEELRGNEWQMSGKKESVEMLYIQTDEAIKPITTDQKWYEKPADLAF